VTRTVLSRAPAATLSRIAADVRRLAPEHLSQAAVTCCKDCMGHTRDHLARLALIGAMALATDASRDTRSRYAGAVWSVRCPKTGVYRVEHDRDHGGDPMLCLHAAFLWAKEETKL